MVRNLAALGKTVLLTTHYMDEAQYLADRVAVISDGRIVAEGPPATLGNRERARARIRYRLPDGAVPPAGLSRRRPDRRVGRTGHRDDLTADAAPAHRLGARAARRARRTGGDPALPRGRLPGAHRRPGRARGRRRRGRTRSHELTALRPQVRYVNKAFWRNPASAFFTFAFPLMFLVIFTALLGHGTVHIGDQDGEHLHLLRGGHGVASA